MNFSGQARRAASAAHSGRDDVEQVVHPVGRQAKMFQSNLRLRFYGGAGVSHARFDAHAFVAVYGTKFHHPEHHQMNANATSVNKIKGPAYHVRVIDRALSVLEVLADKGQPLSLVRLSKSLDLPKSTTMRLLMVLEGHRFVQKSAESGLYRLGLKLFELGSKAVAQFDLTERARPYLERLVSGTGETAYLSVLDGGEALVLERVESSRAVRVPTSVGWRHPAASIFKPTRQTVDPEAAVGIEHHFDDARVFEVARDRRSERGAQHARTASERF